MYLINDIEVLQKIGQHKILDFMLSNYDLAISGIKLTEYSGIVFRQIQKYPRLKKLVADEKFDSWRQGRAKNLSIGDLSTVYIAITQNAKIITSLDDFSLESFCSLFDVETIGFDEFIVNFVTDDRLIKIYNLIKVA